ncbi:hypothetical protein [Chitinophaga defluvii]|uniref:Uncharacterized protein n=1 Tax=Chitinophaga defluvii TaxID=3163343 RepID=A0ABV2TF21_9BACT
MSKIKITWTILLMTISALSAYASIQRDFTFVYYINANETGPTGDITISSPCSNLGRGCIHPIPALGNQYRQLFIEQDGVLIPIRD